MEQELENRFDEFEKPSIIRRKLLPWWIKIFCWIFMLMGGCSVGALIFNLFTPSIRLSIYGFTTYNAFSGVGMFIIAIVIFKGYAAYALWFEKQNAILIGKFDAIAGIAICLFSMIILPFVFRSIRFEFRFELILLIIFYIRLNKIEYKWNNLKTI
jgi:hypothetical protein